MVLVGSVVAVAEVDGSVLEAVDEVLAVEDVLAVADTLAWRSTNSFCSAALKLDPLLLVELTALALLLVLDEDTSDVDDGSNGLLVVLLALLLPVTL